MLSLIPPSGRYSHEELRNLCDRGVQIVMASPEKIAIRFQLFNETEKQVVDEYMSRKYPTVEYFCRYNVFTPH